MAIGHFLIILLPKEEYEPDNLCFEFDEEDDINEYISACTVFQLCNFFNDKKSIDNVLEDYTGDMEIKDLFSNIISVNHTSKSLLLPYLTEGDITETILKNGTNYGVSIVDFRNIETIRYCFLLNDLVDYSGYVVVDTHEYLKIHYDYFAAHNRSKDALLEIRNDHLKVFKMNIDFELIPQEEVEQLFPKLFK